MYRRHADHPQVLGDLIPVQLLALSSKKEINRWTRFFADIETAATPGVEVGTPSGDGLRAAQRNPPASMHGMFDRVAEVHGTPVENFSPASEAPVNDMLPSLTLPAAVREDRIAKLSLAVHLRRVLLKTRLTMDLEPLRQGGRSLEEIRRVFQSIQRYLFEEYRKIKDLYERVDVLKEDRTERTGELAERR
jgi:hypothetical protein